ncbi:uncharacterized protein EI90DRAFT_3058630 [Cantharellus anzutake]|uniref:uncharacterized protein n=1 Tax=Cantharellus anzutake TaxID=1750568 RepID=UPI001907E844|nr:uncharacterized protein EI90DRAFT_3058630 [Cantharellus anzutake]KAF8331123.1 hypothetical protein EI90DRAFT_3058630 [Cantharellus anzutake]
MQQEVSFPVLEPEQQGIIAPGSSLYLLSKLRQRTKQFLSGTGVHVHNTLACREHEDQSYGKSDAQTQSLIGPSAPRPTVAPAEPPPSPPEESHIQVNFTNFCNAVFGTPPPQLSEAAERVVKSRKFLSCRKRYMEMYSFKKDLPVFRADPDIQLMRLLNLILIKVREFGFDQRYLHDIHYAKRPQRERRSKSSQSFSSRCLGVEVQTTANGKLKFGFSNALVTIDANPSLIPSPSSDASSWRLSDNRVPPSSSPNRSPEPRHDHSPGGTKRQHRESPPDMSAGSNRHGKRQRPDPIPKKLSPPTPDPSSLKHHALRTLSTIGNRRHVLGIHVDGNMFQLWYFDRAGSICSSKISIKDDAELFATSIVLFSLASKERLGYEPCFEAPAGMKRRSWSTIRNHEVGVEGYRFRLLSAASLYGRGTFVYEAELISGPVIQSGRLAIKCSWQPISKHPEDELYRLANQRGVSGLATLHASCTVSLLSDGVRGDLFANCSYQDRELRVQVLSPFCVPLYTVQNMDTFQTAFTSLVAAHHELHEKAGILHRDISPNNLMVDSSDPTKGVLIDLDMAVRDRNPDTGESLNVPVLPGAPIVRINVTMEDPCFICPTVCWQRLNFL